jgi:DNA uptake protein ComE-like DNA-binding protein
MQMTPRAASFIVLPILSLTLSSCSQQRIEDSPAYQAVCHGPPLRTSEQRNQAMEDGYQVNREYDCIDKTSFAALNAQRAAWTANNTPEAIAKRLAERAKVAADERARRNAASEKKPPAEPAIPVPRLVEVNTATETELKSVGSLGPDVAAQILEERKNGPFKHWPDLINRVVGLSSAQNAIYASVCGLIVDGASLPGAPPDAAIATAISAN